jgi:hypothetical protein
MWSKTAPTEPGWYWYRDGARFECVEVERCQGTGELFAFPGHPEREYMVDMFPGEWWPVPIPRPEGGE